MYLGVIALGRISDHATNEKLRAMMKGVDKCLYIPYIGLNLYVVHIDFDRYRI